MTNSDYVRASKLARELIPRRSYVKSFPGGVRIALTNSFDELDSFFCSDEKLDTVHPQFSTALHLYGSCHPYFRASDTQRIIQLLTCDIFVINAEGAALGIQNVNQIVRDNDNLYLDDGGVAFVEVSDITTKVSLKIPVETDAFAGVVSKSWLNTHYPGWEKRLDVSASLDLDKIDCLRAALTNLEVITGVTFPDIEF